MNVIKKIKLSRLSYFISVIFAFSISVSIAVTNILLTGFILLSIIFFVFGDVKKKISELNFLQKSFIVVSFLVFVSYIFSIIKSEDQLKALEIAGREFALILFPIFFLFYKNEIKPKVNNILKAFMLGNIVAILICIINAVFIFFTDENVGKGIFFYRGFSVFRHPGYFATYISTAYLFLYFIYIKKIADTNFKQKLVIFFISILFAVPIFLLSSRAGFLTFFLVLFITTIHFFIFSKSKKTKIFLILIFLSSISVLYFNPRFNKIKDIFANINSEKTKPNKKAARIILWKAAFESISENLITGVGTTSVHSALYEKHKIKYYQNLGSHNQFIEIFVESGLFAFIFLIMFFILAFSEAFRQKKLIIITFLLIIFISFMFEVFLEVVNGGAFFVPFFLSLFLFSYSSNEKLLK